MAKEDREDGGLGLNIELSKELAAMVILPPF